MSVKERWEGYRGKVYGNMELPEVQERECAQAFYAGMFAGFVDLLEISNNSSEEDAVEKVEAFRRELTETALANLSLKKA